MNIKAIAELIIGAIVLTGCGGAANSAAQETSAPKAAETAAQTTASQTVSEEAAPKERDIDPTKPVIALTFDDGPNTKVTPRVLDTLEKYDAVGTFFLIGNNINDESAEQARRAYEMGCEIGSHSLTHSYMDKMTAEEIEAEITETNKRIKDAVGVEPVFFRPPYIAVSPTMYQTIDMPFICGFGCNDWVATTTKEERIDGVLNSAQDGAIILLHDFDSNYPTAFALDTIIPELQDQGYQLVTVSELFEAKGKDPHSAAYKNQVISLVK
ncbi:MAG: polysaccharide deacetylase family protein [Oscillospiraceae bacterium]|nr:polysaccharide deacetylase family protein [Oscillospiraceae bacterium]